MMGHHGGPCTNWGTEKNSKKCVGRVGSWGFGWEAAK